jgi:hypothetical protein
MLLKCRLAVNGIHNFIYQNIELSITTAARTPETYKMKSSKSVPLNYIYILLERRKSRVQMCYVILLIYCHGPVGDCCGAELDLRAGFCTPAVITVRD